MRERQGDRNHRLRAGVCSNAPAAPSSSVPSQLTAEARLYRPTRVSRWIPLGVIPAFRAHWLRLLDPPFTSGLPRIGREVTRSPLGAGHAALNLGRIKAPDKSHAKGAVMIAGGNGDGKAVTESGWLGSWLLLWLVGATLAMRVRGVGRHRQHGARASARWAWASRARCGASFDPRCVFAASGRRPDFVMIAATPYPRWWSGSTRAAKPRPSHTSR